MPGPACYGHGGREPTVTDAHVVLGHLPDRLLGGRMALDVGQGARGDPRARRRAARPHASRTPRAASWRSSTTTWWARCASSRSSAGTIRATSRWCRSAAPGRCTAARSPRLLGISARAGAAGARRALRGRAARRRPEGGVQPHAAQGRPGRRRAGRGDLRRARRAGRRLVLGRGRRTGRPSTRAASS